MMFCNQCGRHNPDGAKFCNSCGAPLAAPSNAAMQQRQQDRNAEMEELQKMIHYFSQKGALYEEYDRVCAAIDRTAKGKHYALLVWGIIVSALGMFFFAMLRTGEPAYSALAAIPFLIGQAMIVGHIVYAVSFDKKKAQLNRRYDELSAALFEHYKAYGYCAVGPEYTNPSNLTAILNTIRSGRADSIKEALNVLVNDAYRNNMQQLAAQTARSAAAAARGAKTGAVFSAANFFLK